MSDEHPLDAIDAARTPGDLPPMPGATIYMVGMVGGQYLNTVESFDSIVAELEPSHHDDLTPTPDFIEVTGRFDYDSGRSVARVRVASHAIGRIEEWTPERWQAVQIDMGDTKQDASGD